MRVLVAGATGVIGDQLVPQLLDQGHEVVGLARSDRRVHRLRERGAEVVVADALDPSQTADAVARARPDAVVNLLTALPADIDPRHIDSDMATTNRLRTEGARNLFAGVRQAGVERCVVESIAFITDPAGPDITDESAPVWPSPPKKFAPSIDAVVAMEADAARLGATVLRFGQLYGPGTTHAHDGATTSLIRSGKMPIVGGGGSVFSFVHTADAARAVVVALATTTKGVFNVVDDDPSRMSVWLPAVADMLGARAPKRIPRWLAQMAVGEYGVAWMTSLRGSSNARARELLGWAPRRPTWRDGMREELAGDAKAA